MTEKGDGYEIDLEYPTILVPGNPDVSQAVNEVIETAKNAAIDEFKGSLEPPDPEFDTGPSTLTGTFEATLLSEDSASFRLTLSRYATGAAHPGAEIQGFNFELPSGRRLALADNFKIGTPYLELLSERCRAVLKEKLSDGGEMDEFTADWIEEGTLPTAENFDTWNLVEGGLEITFQEYQVGPYALGPVLCAVPSDSLADVLAQ